jgi:hypothetical protein
MKNSLFIFCLFLIVFALKLCKADVEITKESYVTNSDNIIITNYEVIFIKEPIIESTNN